MGWAFGHATDPDDQLDFDATRTVLRRTAGMLVPYRRGALAASGLLVIWTAMLLAGPLLVRRAIDEGLAKDNVGQLNLSIALYVVVAIVSYVCYRNAIVLLARVGENFLRDMRNRVFAQLRPMRKWSALSFSLIERVDHPTIRRKVIPHNDRYHHVANLAGPEEFDPAVRQWITDAYLLDAEPTALEGSG